MRDATANPSAAPMIPLPFPIPDSLFPIPMRRFLFALLLAIPLASCSRRDSSAAADSVLAGDLELASQATPDLLPADTALGAEPAPATKAPAQRAARPATTPARTATPPREREPAPSTEPSPAPSQVGPFRGIAAGTSVGITVPKEVCTSARPGDKFVATIAETVVGSGGAELPAGSQAVVEVAEVRSGETAAATMITFRVRSISVSGTTVRPQGTALPADTLRRTRVNDRAADRRRVIGGAVLGAIAGQVLGKDTKATVIGAAAGAAAGTVAATRNADWLGCLPAGARLRLVLDAPIEMGNGE